MAHIRDIMNPPGMFKDGQRQEEYSSRYLLPASGRLLPEFDVEKRRSIKDMFARKPTSSTLSRSASTASAAEKPVASLGSEVTAPASFPSREAPKLSSTSLESHDSKILSRKRSQPAPAMPAKRSKSVAPSNASAPGQKSLKGFFKPKTLDGGDAVPSPTKTSASSTIPRSQKPESPTKSRTPDRASVVEGDSQPRDSTINSPSARSGGSSTQPSPSKTSADTVIDPIVSKEDWTKLFTKKPVPRCDSHQEPCVSLTTKKPGMNRGRAFWICPRPLGPSGEKEKGTQWRCPTFIWASDWNGIAQTES